MGFVSKMMEPFRLNVSEEDEELDEEFDEEEEIYDDEPAPRKKGGFFGFGRSKDYEDEDLDDEEPYDDEADDIEDEFDEPRRFSIPEPEKPKPEKPKAEKPVKKQPVLHTEPRRPSYEEKAVMEETPKKTTSKGHVKTVGSAPAVEVCMLMPKENDDANEIADLLLEGKVVVLNLEGTNTSVGQRIIDFVSGACYTMAGNVQVISKKIFIATPSNVELSGEFLENLSDQIELSSLNLEEY